MKRVFFLPLAAVIVLAAHTTLKAQQDLVEKKAKSGEFVGEKALKGKSSKGAVGGGYRYGKKSPPKGLKGAAKPTTLTAPPPPGAAGKDSKPGAEKKEPSTSDAVAYGILGLFLLPVAIGVGAGALQQEAAKQQLFGGKP